MLDSQHLSETWLHAQHIGLLAYVVRSLPLGLSGTAHRAERFERTHDLLANSLSEYPRSTSRPRFFRSLPPQVLALLEQTLDSRKVSSTLRALRGEVREARDELLHREEGAPFGRVQAWAYHVLLGISEADRLIAMGRTLFGASWSVLEDEKTTVTSAIATLRDPLAPTAERCAAITRLSNVLNGAHLWAQVANTLYHHQFAWPLLVLGSTSSSDALAIGLPVSVDLAWPRRAPDPGHRRRHVRIDLSTNSFIEMGWNTSLEKALRTAKALCLSRYGASGESWIERVQRAEALIGFSTTEAVCAPLELVGFSSLKVDGGSAESYFSQVLLQQFLGRNATSGTAATGVIVQQSDSEGRVRFRPQLRQPAAVGAKIRYVIQSCGLFERLLLPVVPLGIKTDSKLREGVQLRAAPDLFRMADLMQADGWNRRQYVRCPDVACYLSSHRLGDEEQKYAPTVTERIRETLRQSVSPVVDFSEYRGVDVLDALKEISRYPRTLGRRDSRSKRPLAWVIFRAVGWESGIRFWRSLLYTLGCSPFHVEQFESSRDAEEAAECFARLLDQMEPNEAYPSHAAPDIITILAFDALRRPDAQGEEAKLFNVETILKKVCHISLRNCDHSLLADTRIILVADDAWIERSYVQPRLTEIDATLGAALRQLSVFPYDIPPAAAALLLGREARTLLPSAIEGHYLLEDAGVYYIPKAVRRILGSDDPATLAVSHSNAGLALAPYLTQAMLPKLSLDRAFYPWYLHDASYHFIQAINIAQKGRNYKVLNAATQRRTLLSRFTEPVTWGTVGGLARRGTPIEALQIGEWLLQRRGRVGMHEWSVLAGTAIRAARDRGAESARDAVLDSKVHEYCERALEAGTGVERLPILTNYAAYLFEADSSDLRDEALSLEATGLLREGNVGQTRLAWQWCEFMGDKIEDHLRALEWYRLGIFQRSAAIYNFVKAIGAASLGKRDESAADLVLLFRMNERISRSDESYRLRESIRQGIPRLRWKAGFLQLFGVEAE